MKCRRTFDDMTGAGLSSSSETTDDPDEGEDESDGEGTDDVTVLALMSIPGGGGGGGIWSSLNFLPIPWAISRLDQKGPKFLALRMAFSCRLRFCLWATTTARPTMPTAMTTAQTVNRAEDSSNRIVRAGSPPTLTGGWGPSSKVVDSTESSCRILA